MSDADQKQKLQFPVIFSHADGLLDILDCDLKQLVRTDPISNSYHVEETPFARWVPIFF